ncbi:Ig-like domain-containing protein [Methanobacterium congolense]|nr:Ig-like domain-containing protein [Methanobacterium congolense]
MFVVLMTGSVSAANTTCVVSVSSWGNASNNYNAEPVISADGRYVVFSSEATNLVPEDGNGCDDIFVRDMLLGVTTLISHPNGGESNGNSYAPSISGDGRYVAFVSSATNLVSGDGNGCDDVFVFDRTSDSMKRISLAVNGTEANSYSDTPSVNGDGRFIAFVSDASNLVTDDGNGCSDIFLYDQTLNKLLRISTASNGTESDGMSYEPSISGDGRYVAFTSYADNLVSDDTNWRKDVFVFDRISGSLERVSVSSTGQEAVTDSDHPSISADGRYVVFTSGYIRPRVALAAARFSHSYVDSLVPGDVNGFTDVFVRDRLLNTTQIVTMSWNGTGTDADSFGPSVNADGTKIAFGSWADNVVVDDNNGLPDIFLTSISAPLNVTGNLQPVIVRSGDKVTVTANVNNPAVSVTALILQKTYNLTQSSNGAWTLQYTVPGVSSGVYSVILTVLDSYGNTGTVDLNFTVDNTANCEGQCNTCYT